MSAPVILGLMTVLFLAFGYLGVPVAFSLLAGVFIGAAFTDVTFPAIVQKMFDGMDSEALHGTPRLVAETMIRLVVLGVAGCLIWFGYLNFLRGFSSFRMPSMTPIASLYAAIPIAGALIALFTVEQLVNGWRNGFDHPPERDEVRSARATSAPAAASEEPR